MYALNMHYVVVPEWSWESVSVDAYDAYIIRTISAMHPAFSLGHQILLENIDDARRICFKMFLFKFKDF